MSNNEMKNVRNGTNDNAIANDKINNGKCIVHNDNHSLPSHDDMVIVNLDRGDPKMYYPYWKKLDDKCQVTIKAWELMSYFADNSATGVFYQLPEFTDVVHRLHRTVGNAVTEGRYVVAGTGSSQLFTVTLRAIASSLNAKNNNKAIPVVCASPYYSCYEESIMEEKSKMYEWHGDANTFEGEGPYIEVVTTPNNPDGTNKKPVVNRKGGVVICDLAYYWPQYTPITHMMDYDIMLFTLSKVSGHAGSRVGWAIVKDKDIASNMIKQMTLMTIGTCHEGQLRASKILEHIVDTYNKPIAPVPSETKPPSHMEGFFEFGYRVLAQRWEKLRAAIKHCGSFKLLDFPSEFCNLRGKVIVPYPAYAWLESNTGEDAANLLNELKIRTRGGKKFGVSSKYTRVSLLESDESFNLFIERLSTLGTSNGISMLYLG